MKDKKPASGLSAENVSAKLQTVATHKPNIKFIGRDRWDRAKRKIVEQVLPIESFTMAGGITITLPDSEAQIANRVFYSEDAGIIAQIFPHLYKRVNQKG